MAMNSTPAGNVAENTWVCAGDSELVTDLKVLDSILGFNDRHWAEKAPEIQFDDLFRHASY